MPRDYVLQVCGVSKRFPGVQALDRVRLEVAPGQVHALLGENGAGKSTLMRTIRSAFGQKPRNRSSIPTPRALAILCRASTEIVSRPRSISLI
jgi:ABC-type phosphate/phosphonate transport system ATPase subunit